jgi:hypothetical protein
MKPEDSRPPPGALPLLVAMHKWVPEKVLAAVDAADEDLKRNARKVYRIDAQGREVVEIDATSDFNRPLLRRMREAQAEAEATFLALLRAGRLVAWAREGSPVAPLRRIPADAWASLRLEHVAEGRARGHGVNLFGIHVAPATALQRAFPAGEPKANDNAADAGTPPAEILATGTPGRPTSMHLIRAEHRRRLDAGEAHHSLAKEARHLAAWFAAAHPNAPQPTPKTIENGIPATHRQHAPRPPK